ncbi:hypothetical protein DKX38_019293 [Salix brachista]|uniref:AAA+ ATPase domain-containing protein n=1 Tax=Salix brachista TaxID=2182728 RepID=A0A5N5KFU1_9ROSI|nr:hypothetical protein DKX38_019293 [Salix brachista]
MEIVGSMASTVVELLFHPIKRSVSPVFNYSRNVKSLETHMEELSDKKTRVLHYVEEATNKTEVIHDDVEKWLASVDDITEKADRVLEDKDKAKKWCFMGLFPNLMTRYRVSTEIESIDEEAVNISLNGDKFDRVSYLPARRGIGDRSVEDYEAFESRRHVLDGILEALKDKDVNLVGVWGMAGVGKTKIVKKVAEQVKANRIFDVVVLAVVSKTPDLRKIQGQIADGLGFELKAETDSGRAERLRERLERETKALVILDDIWERLELDDVGIPSGSDNRGCKILMTSRDGNALNRGMDTQKLFHLEVLLENEAWNLFQNKAGDAIKNPDLKPVAVEVAKRCAGLPIYLVTVASALKDGDLSEWKDALERLKRFDKDDIDNIDSRVYSALELSYTSLKGEEIKSVFLLCGQLVPHHIPIHDLLRYTVGLGLFKRISTLEEARHRLNKLVNDLIACCLLEGGADGIVKMHDVLHGFAASVASRDHHVFTSSFGTVLREWPAKDMLEQYSAISLPYCKISGLPEVLNCPKLESFILYNTDPSLKIPDCLFEGTKTLQLMDMTRVQLPTLPSSLQFLEKLQTLCLDFCVLGDIALIGEIKMLKVLSLIGSNIDRLPREIGQLTRLQLLDLTHNPTLEIIPPNVLSCLTQLEDLYMESSFLQWGVEGLDDRRNNASLAELKDLPCLSTLYLHITDPMILPKDFFSKKLERFHILIGEGWDWSRKRETSTIMKLKINASIQSEEGIQFLLKRTEDLHLDGLEGVKSVSYELDGQGFPSLKHLHIQNSLEIRYIVDSTMSSPIVAFPFLVSLSLDNLNKLEKICNGQPVAESFSKLRILKVKSCPMLKNLFSLHMERVLLQLEEISIIDCKIMEVIVAEESGGEADEDEAIKLTQLRTLTLEYLPQFTSVSSKSNAASISQTRPEPLITDVRSNEIASDTGVGTSMTLFNKKIQFPNLEDLKLSSIEVEKIWQDQPGELSYGFVRLTSLIVEGCRNLKYLFTTSMVESLAQLKRLELCDCVSMEEIIIKNGLGEEENVRGMMLPKLEFLKLKGLPNLTRFCTGHLIQCCFLQELWIEDFPALKTFISNSLSTDAVANNQFEETNSTLFDEKVAFSNIEKLHIVGMDNLNMIWHTEFQSDSFCKLKVLKVKQGNKLLNIFPPNMLRRFQNLEHLEVDYCASLEEVFDLRSLMNEKESHVVTAFKLKNMYVWNLQKLKKVWNTNPHGILSFQNLYLVNARNCPSLKSLFPASVALGLPQLEELRLNNCGVEEIVAEEERLGEAPKFVFPKTSTFILWDLPKLKSFYPGRHTSEWPVLKKIVVYRCDEVPVFDLELQSTQGACTQDQLGIQVQQPLFSFEKVIPNLEELSLKVKDAAKVCQGQFSADLFHKDEAIKLTHLRTLTLEYLPQPTSVSSKSNAASISQTRPEPLITDVRSHENASDAELRRPVTLFNKKIEFPNLEDLKLSSIEVEKIWPDQPLELSYWFVRLTSLIVEGCRNLKYLFTTSMVESLAQLKRLELCDCVSMDEIIIKNGLGEEENMRGMMLPKLEFLKLKGLPNLTRFCTGHLIQCCFLQELWIEDCPALKTFISKSLSTDAVANNQFEETNSTLFDEKVAFSNIEKLHIVGMDNLNMIWHTEFHSDSFCKLKVLKVKQGHKLLNIFPPNMLRRFQNLEHLEVDYCASLEEVFDLRSLMNEKESHVVTAFKLKNMYVWNLQKLKKVWNTNPHGILSFQNLYLVNARNCPSLKSLFPASVALGLPQLEELRLNNCGVEEIVAEEERLGEAPKFVFPKTSSFILWGLRKLKSFYPGRHTSEWPVLKEIVAEEERLGEAPKFVFPKTSSFILWNLPKLKSFYPGRHTSEWPVLKKMDVYRCNEVPVFDLEQDQLGMEVQQPLFSIEKVIPNLEELWLNAKDAEKVCQGQFSADLFHKVRVLGLQCFDGASAEFPLGILHRFQNMEKLVVYGGCFKELFPCQLVDEEEHTLARIRCLKLSNLLYLEKIWNQDLRVDQLLQNLETLEVLYCDSLINLAPSASSFGNLTALHVRDCKALKYLVTSSTARSLVQLSVMSIKECETVTEIVARNGDEAGNEIIFRKLESLKLDCLASLTSFCSVDFTFRFPCLTEVIVTNCPKMKTFSLGILSTPRLQKIGIPSDKPILLHNLKNCCRVDGVAAVDEDIDEGEEVMTVPGCEFIIGDEEEDEAAGELFITVCGNDGVDPSKGTAGI